ncbi:glycosyltransferase [Parabacteroides distasonis]|nr:glycosyltransferase [Parabacteroides distasonis]
MPILLQINTTLNSGSTGRIAEQIALLAESKGWTCYVAHGCRYVNESKVKHIQIGTKIGNYIHAFIGEYLGLHGFGSVIATYIFIRKLKKIRPDVVHLHNLHGYYINIKLLFEYLAKENLPVVWTLHDCWSFTGHCTHFENAGCEKWKTGCHDCSLLMQQYKSRIFDRTRNNYCVKKQLYTTIRNMTIVPVSNWLGRYVNKSILQQHQVCVIHNGIDLSVFKPLQSDIRERLAIDAHKKIVLGVVASGFKGKDEFIRLAANNSYQIVLVGINKKWQAEVPDSIICIERTNNQKVLAEYYSIADVFVNPTYDDTFPTTNLEAQACGTPVVTYKAGGSPETLDDKTGISVIRGDFDALSAAIDLVLSKGKQHYSKACRERAEKFFNKDERFEDYIRLYDRVLFGMKNG